MKGKGGSEEQMDTICPFCKTEGLILLEDEREVPYFGKVFLFSMTCNNCKFHKADVEVVDSKLPSRHSVEVSGEKDMKIRVVKSSNARVKIPHIGSIEPGEGSNGYVTNVEGIINRIKNQLENFKTDADDSDTQKKAKRMIKKLNRVVWGDEKIKLIIEDPSGNSAIISDRTKVEKLKQ